MTKIEICDTTLRDGEQTPGVHFGISQKLDIALRLEAMGVDVIEAGFPAASDGDFEAVRRVAGAVKNSIVCGLARCTKGDIDACAAALSHAAHPRIHIFIATSDIHLEHKLHIDRTEALRRIAENTAYAASLFREVQFSAEDATRTDRDFLVEAISCAIKHGANIINVPDTVGYTTPEEFFAILSRLRHAIPAFDEGKVMLGVHCHNDLGLATANNLSAISAGASHVECTVNGLGERAGNAPLEETVMALSVRRDAMGDGVKTGINTREITATSRLVASLSGVPVSPGKAIVGANAFTHASGIHQHGVMQNRQTYEIMAPEEIGLTANTIQLGKLSGRHAFADRIRQMGYSFGEEAIDATFARFKEIADRKAVITDDDIRAILSEYLDSLEGRYRLSTFQIQSGNHIKAMALVTLADNLSLVPGENDTIVPQQITEAAPGEGPVDAAFNAIGRIAGAVDMELKSYEIRAITEGTDALGEAIVKIRAGTSLFTGRGVSTDIIKASIKAYLNAINKWDRAREQNAPVDTTLSDTTV